RHAGVGEPVVALRVVEVGRPTAGVGEAAERERIDIDEGDARGGAQLPAHAVGAEQHAGVEGERTAARQGPDLHARVEQVRVAGAERDGRAAARQRPGAERAQPAPLEQELLLAGRRTVGDLADLAAWALVAGRPRAGRAAAAAGRRMRAAGAA